MHCYRMAFFALGLGETVFLVYVWIEVIGDKIPPSTFFLPDFSFSFAYPTSNTTFRIAFFSK